MKGSRYFESFDLYKENGFKTEEKAKELIAYLLEEKPIQCIVESVEKKKEKKNPPLLYNLAELQNDCSKRFKISPDEALRVVQELYEKTCYIPEDRRQGFVDGSCKRDQQKLERAVKISSGTAVFAGYPFFWKS